jgi:hypothetical protein
MAKAIKPYTSRTPPVPSTSHTEIDEWMQRLVPHLHPIVQALDELIRGTIREVHYAIKWKKAYYGTPKLGWVIEIVAYDVSVNVVFFGGGDFNPPPPLGTVDRSRYIKVTTLEDVEGPDMRKWIRQAGRVPGWQ